MLFPISVYLSFFLFVFSALSCSLFLYSLTGAACTIFCFSFCLAPFQNKLLCIISGWSWHSNIVDVCPSTYGSHSSGWCHDFVDLCHLASQWAASYSKMRLINNMSSYLDLFSNLRKKNPDCTVVYDKVLLGGGGLFIDDTKTCFVQHLYRLHLCQ